MFFWTEPSGMESDCAYLYATCAGWATEIRGDRWSSLRTPKGPAFHGPDRLGADSALALLASIDAGLPWQSSSAWSESSSPARRRDGSAAEELQALLTIGIFVCHGTGWLTVQGSLCVTTSSHLPERLMLTVLAAESGWAGLSSERRYSPHNGCRVLEARRRSLDRRLAYSRFPTNQRCRSWSPRRDCSSPRGWSLPVCWNVVHRDLAYEPNTMGKSQRVPASDGNCRKLLGFIATIY